MVVDFGKRMDLAIVNTYIKKKDEHRMTYKSGGKSTQVDYVMCRRRNLKEMCDYKVILNECVAKQHNFVAFFGNKYIFGCIKLLLFIFYSFLLQVNKSDNGSYEFVVKSNLEPTNYEFFIVMTKFYSYEFL